MIALVSAAGVALGALAWTALMVLALATFEKAVSRNEAILRMESV